MPTELSSRVIHEPYDGPLRWLIPSSREFEKPYLVDLAAYNELGECGCRYWVCECGPKVKQGTPKTCKHVRIAEERFTAWAKHQFAMWDKNKTTDKQV